MESKRNIFVFIIPLIVCVLSLSLLLISLRFRWLGRVKQTTSGYCEMSHEGLFKEPLNTWSNLGFIIVCLIIAWQMMWGSFKENANIFTRSDLMSIFFSSMVICFGPGSMAMHASYTELGSRFDHMSMYLICAFIVAYSTERFFCMGTKYFMGIFLLVVMICELTELTSVKLPIIKASDNLTFAVFITITIVIEILIIFYRKSNIQKRWSVASLIALLFAVLFWALSKNGGPLCDPRSWFQGHAVWHLLDALTLYFLFRYYVSEHNSEQYNLIEESK
jgi:hypothetical protein